MTAAEPRWIGEADVVALMSLRDAIEALESGLAEEAAGTARNLEKTAAHWGERSNMHAIGAVYERAGVFGTKTWGNTPAGSTPLLILWDAETARLRAVIEASALGQMRTGAMSGVATRWMSAAAADDLAVIGSGKQALMQVAAVTLVRPLRRIRVFSPTREKREAFAARLAETFPAIEVTTAPDVAAAVADSAVVTLITRARAPFLEASMVAYGVHVNAAGAITEERREFARGLFPRAGLVAVDTIPAARRLSAELIDWYDHACGGDWSAARRICDIVAAAQPRPAGIDLSLFKPMGMGIADLALGIEILRRADAAGAGRPIPHPQRVVPRIAAAVEEETPR
ncbi:MAG TPA: hypothetical protein VHD15_02100 [Hyphomicrobiales bacterium]|nr:hypothetical protein [Hyphomicrobiales bacterium]